MKKHLKFVLYLIAIALIAYVILDMKKSETYAVGSAHRKMLKAEFLGIKLLDIFLGVLGLAFVGVAAGYVKSLTKGGAPPEVVAQPEGGEVAATKAGVRKKLLLEKALGRTGSKILSAVLITVLVLAVLALIAFVAVLLFPDKVPFLDRLISSAPILAV